MPRNPSLWRLTDLIECASSMRYREPDMPARPLGTCYTLSKRIRAAWLVFTGRADAVIWPGDQ